MKFSIIIPSYNQHEYIEETLKSALEMKEVSKTMGAELEILLFDSESDNKVQRVIETYASRIDYLEIRKDAGQYDAINKGIQKCTGDYWTWLNTDDTLDKEGFIKMVKILQQETSIEVFLPF